MNKAVYLLKQKISYNYPDLIIQVKQIYCKIEESCKIDPLFNTILTKYTCGNDYQFLFGLTDSFIANKLILNPGILMRLWYTSFDKIDGNDFLNTGGSWIYFVPSLNIAFNPKFSTFISVEIPVYQHLNGTQLSTSIRISGGIQLSISSNTRKINLKTEN